MTDVQFDKNNFDRELFAACHKEGLARCFKLPYMLGRLR